VNRVLRHARHIIGHFGDESFQAIICTGTDNSKKNNKLTGVNTQKHPKNEQTTMGNKSTQNTQKTLS